MSSISRREFLKKILLDIGALTLGNLITACNLTTVVNQATNTESSELSTHLIAIYYVDATDGDDLNNGFSPKNPWKTIEKINKTRMNPGDSVLFKCGEIWRGSTLFGQNSVTYNSYGEGERPVIDGDHSVSCFVATNKDNIKLENLTLRYGIDFCAAFSASKNITVSQCEMFGAGNDNLIFINGCSDCEVKGGSYHDPYQREKGPLITCIEIADNGSDFLIDGAEIFNSPMAGLSIHNHSASDPQGRTEIPTNVVLKNLSIHHNKGNGINVMSQDFTTPSTITIENCQTHSNQTGIRVYRAKEDTGYFNGQLNVINCKIQDNKTYGFYIEGDNVIIEKCLTIGSSQQNFVVNSKDITLYNNTIYLSPSTTIFPLFIKGERTEGITIRNTIIFMATQSGQIIGISTGAIEGVTIDYSMYYFPSYSGQPCWVWNGNQYGYEEWKVNSGQDTHSPIISDPLFVNINNGDFTLQTNSPAIDAGVDVGLDYLGNSPDLGFAERE